MKLQKLKIIGLCSIVLLSLSLSACISNSDNAGPQGPAGEDGSTGEDGLSINWLGSQDSAPANPQTNDAYYNTTDGNSYIWDGDSWEIFIPSANGLMAEYLFTGNAIDSTGNGHDGTVNGAALSNDRFGNANSAYYFDGTDDNIDLGTFFTFKTFSISLWIKNTRISTDYSDIIDNNHDWNNRWSLQTFQNSSIYEFADINASILNDQWTHIVMVKELNKVILYVNGSLVASSNVFDRYDDGTQHLVLGYRYGDNDRYYQGYIDDIRMYNRVLTPTETDDLYHENGWDENKVVYVADGINFKMVYVPAKSFTKWTDDSETDSVTMPYRIGDSEVTYELWYKVHAWAIANGYNFANPGREGHDGTITEPAGEPPTTARFEPVTTISWRDAMVWCNALTEWYNDINETNYSCVYTYSSSVIRDSRDTNATACDNVVAVWPNSGFRLLSSDEWQLAARYINDTNNDGDITDAGEYYPGNFASGATEGYTDAAATQLVAWYNANSGTSTHVVKSKIPNALGLYDMSGNVWEWTFDWHPTYVTYRVGQGGSWFNDDYDLPVGEIGGREPYYEDNAIGFRIAKMR